MTDTIIAAIISSTTQVIVGLITMSVAIAALNSWRRNALGTRQLELAEQCLQAVWRLDENIKAARLLLPAFSLVEIKSNEKTKQLYAQRHQAALTAMRACSAELKDLKKLLMISEIYLGEFPRTTMPNTSRFFAKIPYKIEQDYDEIMGGLLSSLWEDSPEFLENREASTENIEKFENSAEMFFGFAYEYEEDDYSVRLRVLRRSFERHVSKVLKRRRITNMLWESLGNAISDRYENKFKPVVINKKSFRKFMEERSKASQLEDHGYSEKSSDGKM